jgi:acyl-CoA dehydrogenase
MDFAPDSKTVEMRERLLAFMEDFVYPAEATFREQAESATSRWDPPPVIEELKAEARARGLWNLFLPATHAHGAGLTNLQYAPLAEITGRSPWIAPEALNCSAPDTGNMELLSLFGTAEQQERWLRPLLDGKIRSAFSMTEPDVASSDATNIATRIVRDGDDYVINGRKWWSSGAMSPRCRLLIVMGVTDPAAERHRRQSMICVPIDTPGVTVRRSTGPFGYHDGPHGGHAEISYDDVRVPVGGLLGAEGDGFRIAQERLGPGRIHHAMRAIGMAERALELMCVRTASRSAFGKPIIEQGVVQEWISRSRVWIEQVRLLVLKTAWLMDTVGNRGARTEVSAIKVAAPEMATWVIDRSIQAHGGAGVSGDFPLAELYAAARAMRIFDGPDEVHHMAIARRETARYRR